MSTTIAVILLLLLAGAPIFVLACFLLRQFGYRIDWKAKAANGLLFLGVLLLVCSVSWRMDYSHSEGNLTKPLTHVSGIVENVETHPRLPERGGLRQFYTVLIDGKWYYMHCVSGYYEDFSDFDPLNWVRNSIGEPAELEIDERDLLSNLIDSADSWRPVRGKICGITDEEGHVLLDADAYRQHLYDTIQSGTDQFLPAAVGGALMLTAGLFLKIRIKKAERTEKS